MDELTARFDALISPTLPTVASPIDQSFESYFSRANRSPLGAAANVAVRAANVAVRWTPSPF